MMMMMMMMMTTMRSAAFFFLSSCLFFRNCRSKESNFLHFYQKRLLSSSEFFVRVEFSSFLETSALFE